jgi:CheY-like chemotaxis protein
VNLQERPTGAGVVGMPTQREPQGQACATAVRTLLVDDNSDILQLLRLTFGFHEGVRVCGAAVNGAEAMSSYAALRPDVIVMDISMPVMTGIEAARRILAEDPTARIVLYSTAFSPCQRAQAEAIGVLECVDKLDFGRLPGLVRQLGGRDRADQSA